MVVVELDSYGLVIFVFTLSIAVFATYRLRRPSRLPDDIPWVGGSTTSFGKLLAPYRSIFRGREFMDEAYYKYGKLDRICVVPNLVGNFISLPQSYIDWVAQQSPRILHGREIVSEKIAAVYTLRRKSAENKPVLEEFMHRQLKLHVDELTSDLMDEVSFSMDELLGLDTNRYKTVNLNRIMKRMTTRTTNRILVGQPLCEFKDLFIKCTSSDDLGRDEDYIENVIRYLDSVPLVAFLIQLLPSRIVPIIGRTLAMVNRFWYLKIARSLSPAYFERMTRWHTNAGVTPNDLPNDWLSWSVDEAMKRDMHKTVDEKLRWLSRTLGSVNFAAIHTSTMSISNFILDIFSTSAGQHCLRDLLTECESLDRKFSSKWNRARITEMRMMDSALRESMRLSPVMTVSYIRRVVAPDGLILPNDIWLPCGTMVQMSAYSVHHDESNYPEPLEYRYARFMQSNDDGTPLKSATTIEPTFLTFGHGRSACPGRFLAVDMIKLITTYLITNYDVKPYPERPKNKWFADALYPPLDATLEVRRRAGTIKPHLS